VAGERATAVGRQVPKVKNQHDTSRVEASFCAWESEHVEHLIITRLPP
jgi:hypothetical protein